MSARPRVRRLARLGALSIGIVVSIELLWLNACVGPLEQRPLVDRTPPNTVDDDFALARRYAPWIFHSVHPTKGRQDLPAPVDFDGDLNGENSWNNLPLFALVPTVYYALLETETHLFLTYHLYHPRDWTLFDVGLHLTHEGDGENLQVVVDKASQRVVLLFTQAHYRGGVYAHPASGFGDGEHAVRGPLTLLDASGRPHADGSHPAIYVQSRGHGIYGVPDAHACVEIDADGRATFDPHGLVLRPAHPADTPSEPALDATEPVPYRLESTTEKLWPLIQDARGVGEGLLFDGTVRYEDARVAIDLPRYHEANRLSGPFGPDRGISPFAVDFGFRSGTLGALFFDPARRYAEVLDVPAPWSLEYVDYPFAR